MRINATRHKANGNTRHMTALALYHRAECREHGSSDIHLPTDVEQSPSVNPHNGKNAEKKLRNDFPLSMQTYVVRNSIKTLLATHTSKPSIRHIEGERKKKSDVFPALLASSHFHTERLFMYCISERTYKSQRAEKMNSAESLKLIYVFEACAN